MIDTLWLDDELDLDTPVIHCNPDPGGGKHIEGGYFDFLCPCMPEVSIEEGVTVIVHRRTQ